MCKGAGNTRDDTIKSHLRKEFCPYAKFLEGKTLQKLGDHEKNSKIEVVLETKGKK